MRVLAFTLAIDSGGVAGQSVQALLPALTVGVVGCVGLAAGTRAEHRPGGAPPHAWIAPLTLGLAVLASHPFIHGGVRAPWSSAEQMIPLGAICATIMGVLAVRVRFDAPVRWAVRGAVLALLLAVALRRVWSRAGLVESAMEIGVCVALSLVAWCAIERVTDRTRGVSGPGVVMTCALSAAGMCVLTGSHSLALSCASIAAACAPLGALALARPGVTIALGGAHVPALVIPLALMLHLTLGAEPAHTARVSALLALAAPIAASAADWPCVCERMGAARTALRIVMAMLVGALAVAAAATGYSPA